MKPEDVTIDEMIEYCEASLMRDPDSRPGAAIISAIINKLKVLKKMEVAWPKEANATTLGPDKLNEDEIGQAIRDKVELMALIDSGCSALSVLPGVGPEPALITKYRQDLELLNARLFKLKTIQKGNLMHKLTSIDTSLGASSLERKDEAELRNFRNDVVTKIAAIDAELKTL